MSTWPGGGEVGRDAVLYESILNRKVINVVEYGAIGDGVTDDTPAIQAAIDACPFGGRVYMPTPTTWYGITNLLTKANMTLEGPSMPGQSLLRLPGSTGHGITEKTVAQGNPSGASGLWLKNIRLHMNGTSGDGINLGFNVPGAQLNFLSGLENIRVSNASSGTGIKIFQNGAMCSYFDVGSCNVGIQTSGGGNVYRGLLAESNTLQDIIIGGTGDTYSGIHTEPIAHATESVKITGGANNIFGLNTTLSGNMTNIVLIATGAVQNKIVGGSVVAQGHTWSSSVFVQAWSNAVVANKARYDFTDTAGTTPAYYYNQTSNLSTSIDGKGISLPTASNITYSASMTPDASLGPYQRITITDGSAMTINAPTGALSGDTLMIEIVNSSGGAHGTITWDPITVYRIAGGATGFPGGLTPAIANGKRRTITLQSDGTHWVESARVDSDI